MKNKNLILHLFISLMTIVFVSCADKAQFSLPSNSEQFEGQIFYNNKVDILFVVDNSKSMLQYQQRLSSRVNSMITTLNNLGMDYRVAVTTSTMSTNTNNFPMTRKLIGNPVYLTAANINQLASRIIVGESGSDLERGLDAMAYVTSPNYLNSIGSDFIRSDALLSLIFISDEVDQSSEFGSPNSNDFVNLLNQRKPAFETGGQGWIANYIGILTNQSCDNLGVHVSIGTQFLKLVESSNGTQSSICNADLASAVSTIQARIVDQLTAFRFKEAPNKSTIVVTVGGQIISEDATNGWTLESELINGKSQFILRFHGQSIPASFEKVTVNYQLNSAS